MEISTIFMPKSILLIGGPSTGKTTLINHLKTLGYPCLEEISRHVIKKAQGEGIDQLFLEKPLLFSRLLKDARIQQHQEVATFDTEYVFLDRGIPDTVAYLDYIGQTYTQEFINDSKKYKYDYVFIFPVWKEIHETDAERYESFEQAQKIQEHLLATYLRYGYSPIEVPKNDVITRATFIINTLKD